MAFHEIQSRSSTTTGKETAAAWTKIRSGERNIESQQGIKVK